jgi:hypothetical protein
MFLICMRTKISLLKKYFMNKFKRNKTKYNKNDLFLDIILISRRIKQHVLDKYKENMKF